MPKIQTYDIYTIVAAGATKTYVSTDVIDIYEINASGGTITLLADMIFSYSGTPDIGCEFKFQYSGGITQNLEGGISVSFFGTNLTNAQALSPLIILAYWNGITWEITIIKDTVNNVTSVTTFGSTPNTNGLSITSGGVLNMQPANNLFGGGVSTTTQTFAGAKTFNILSGNFEINSIGVGIGVAPTSRLFINSTKTFTDPLVTIASDILSNNLAIFTYSGNVTESNSSCACAVFSSKVTGTFTPKNLYGSVSAVTNEMSTTFEKSISSRGSHISSGTINTTTAFNADFLSVSFANKSNTTSSTTISSNYSFHSSVPFQNNSAVVDPLLFSITTQYGFYCENYKGADKIPSIYGSGGGTRKSATITNAWQIYMSGTNLTTIGSYIGNRLGIGFTTEPTINNQITALLHIGAGTTSTAQIKLEVSSAPISPNDGDIWLQDNTNTGLKIRLNGVTKTVTVS